MPSLSASSFSLKEARAEYSRLRKIASKRLARLEASEFADAEIVKQHLGLFRPLPKELSARDVRKALYEVAKFLNAKASTVSGQRETRRLFVETMQDRGYDFVTKENAADFGRFMDRVKKHYGSKKGYYPEGTIELYQEIVKRKADPQQVAEAFEFYLEDIGRIPDAAQIKKEEARQERARKKLQEKLKKRTEKYRQRQRAEQRRRDRKRRR